MVIRYLLVLFTVFFWVQCTPKKSTEGANASLDTLPTDLIADFEDTVVEEIILPKLQCDSSRIKGFKNNLVYADTNLINSIAPYIDSIAKNYIHKECTQDSLFCSPFHQKIKNVYTTKEGYTLFSVGYVYTDGEKDLQPGACNLYVFGAEKNGQIVAVDIAQDLEGELTFGLKGFEKPEGAMIFWGEMYPYFGKNYGRFKLVINDTKKGYIFECTGRNPANKPLQ